ncbi:hypothetical protein AXW83_13650 [Bosea sp. PAMC 26642]|nr:hypothetical protein AXW83_13650 [Bosea sp. PAMC 26642]
MQFTRRHLLLGNGFSIACCPDIFHYGSLFKAANLSKHPELAEVFKVLGTQDFELAIKNLESGALLAGIYTPGHIDAPSRMRSDAHALKEILLTTIAGHHPNIPAEIPDIKFWSCRRFLDLFLGRPNEGQIFTLNYDLLLYWTLMHEDDPFGTPVNMSTNDGFGNDEDDPEADYVVWQGEVNAHSARIHFLHGALHLFDAGNELQKFTWIRTNDRLIDQARKAMNANKFPLFVSEGSSAQKKNKIRHNAYLYQGFKQFTANAQQGRHCFFILGHSLADNDDHILRRLGSGRCKKIYISLFGDVKTDSNKAIIQKAKSLAAMRHERSPLDIAFFDASTANPWQYA